MPYCQQRWIAAKAACWYPIESNPSNKHLDKVFPQLKVGRSGSSLYLGKGLERKIKSMTVSVHWQREATTRSWKEAESCGGSGGAISSRDGRPVCPPMLLAARAAQLSAALAAPLSVQALQAVDSEPDSPIAEAAAFEAESNTKESEENWKLRSEPG